MVSSYFDFSVGVLNFFPRVPWKIELPIHQHTNELSYFFSDITFTWFDTGDCCTDAFTSSALVPLMITGRVCPKSQGNTTATPPKSLKVGSNASFAPLFEIVHLSQKMMLQSCESLAKEDGVKN